MTYQIAFVLAVAGVFLIAIGIKGIVKVIKKMNK